MERNHKFVLTMLASFSLLMLGASTVNAKGINSARHVNQNQSAQVVESNPIKADPKSIIVNPVKGQVSLYQTDLKNNQHKASEVGRKANPTKAAEVALKKAHSKSLAYDKVTMPNKPLRDKNHQDIGNMKKFIKIRKPYRYVAIGGNTRDLGGYPTADHKYQTKADRIIRSADLDGLSDNGLKTLKKLHVNKIVDLRYPNSKNGIKGHPDPDELQSTTLNGTGISYQKSPVYSYNESHQFKNYMNDHDIHGEYYYYGAPSVTEPQAIKAYRRVFHDLLSNKHGAILFHCNLGRDRTGVTSALILSALGVDRNVIYHDYLLTDHYHYKYQPSNILSYPKQAGELAYFFSVINHKYGSVSNYLHHAVGLSHQDIKKLRLMYLVPNHR